MRNRTKNGIVPVLVLIDTLMISSKIFVDIFLSKFLDALVQLQKDLSYKKVQEICFDKASLERASASLN